MPGKIATSVCYLLFLALTTGTNCQKVEDGYQIPVSYPMHQSYAKAEHEFKPYVGADGGFKVVMDRRKRK